jgi:hypothetical protein
MPPCDVEGDAARRVAGRRRDVTVMRIGVLVAETGGMVPLASDLRGPVGLQLARAVEQLPGEHGMPGGSRYELKWDGFLH